jgi:hypothetical protein
MIKNLGVQDEDFKVFIAITLLLSTRKKRPVSYREAFGIIVKHYKGCFHAEV